MAVFLIRYLRKRTVSLKMKRTVLVILTPTGVPMIPLQKLVKTNMFGTFLKYPIQPRTGFVDYLLTTLTCKTLRNNNWF